MAPCLDNAEPGTRNQDGARHPRIGLVLWSGEIGGAELWTTALCTHWARLGIPITVVTVCNQGPLTGRLRRSGLEVLDLGAKRGRDVWRHLARLREFRLSASCDVLIVPTCGFLNLALRIAGFTGAIVAIEHGSQLRMLSRNPFKSLVRVIAELSGVWTVDGLVAPSDFMLRHAIRPPRASVIRRVYPGVDLALWPSRPANVGGRAGSHDLTIGFAGRLARGKGLDVVLRAMAKCKRSQDLRLEVAGDGPMRAEWAELAVSLGIDDRVHFRGWIDSLADFWQECDVAVVPSFGLSESFGMTAIEAMSGGVPIVVSNCGGLAEILSRGDCGSAFPPGDVEALASQLDDYAEHPDVRLARGASARKCVERDFNIERCASELRDVCSKVVGRRRCAHSQRSCTTSIGRSP